MCGASLSPQPDLQGFCDPIMLDGMGLGQECTNDQNVLGLAWTAFSPSDEQNSRTLPLCDSIRAKMAAPIRAVNYTIRLMPEK